MRGMSSMLVSINCVLTPQRRDLESMQLSNCICASIMCEGPAFGPGAGLLQVSGHHLALHRRQVRKRLEVVREGRLVERLALLLQWAPNGAG